MNDVYAVLGFWAAYCLFGLFLYRRHRSRGEATKRTDPKMNVLADEPKTAKSGQGDENENERKSERQVLR